MLFDFDTEISIILGLLGVFLFFAGREILAWYAKTNEILALLKEIRDRLPLPPPPSA